MGVEGSEKHEIRKLSRREFVRLTGTTVSGLGLAIAAWPATGGSELDAIEAQSEVAAQLQAYVAVHPNGRVSIVAPIAEMGQGVFSSLPMLIAEELDVPWEVVDVKQPFASEAFINPLARDQYAAESRSIRGMFLPLRRLGATLRQMLVSAAAREWATTSEQITTTGGFISHRASDRRAHYADFIGAASELPVPLDVQLKKRSYFTLIGQSSARKDIPSKVNGSAVFGADADFPGAKRAAVRHASMTGGRIEDFRVPDDLSERFFGLMGIYRVSDEAIAAVAEDFWTADRALAEVELVENGPSDYNDESELARLISALDESGQVALERGHQAGEPANSHRFTYTAPLLAHFTMEPQCCAAWVDGTTVHIKAPTQGPRRAQARVATALGLDHKDVRVDQTFLGGGFGRRAEDDYAIQAARLSQLAGVPIRLQWSREEDTRHDFYRPAYAARYEAELGGDGSLRRVTATIAGHALLAQQLPDLIARTADPTAVNGMIQPSYKIPNARTAFVRRDSPLPQGFWRSVANSMNCFFGESCIDELAYAAGVDPGKFRLQLLPRNSRAFAVMEEALAHADWGQLDDGVFQGLALCEAYESVIVQVVELARSGDAFRVARIISVVDCGLAVDPATVEAQIEGGAIFGLTAALYGKITVREGVVQQSNFNDQPVLTLADCPEFITRIVESSGSPGGVGEIGTPAIAPALANALFAATGQRQRNLPLSVKVPNQNPQQAVS